MFIILMVVTSVEVDRGYALRDYEGTGTEHWDFPASTDIVVSIGLGDSVVDSGVSPIYKNDAD
jgi:hypothetical protein